MRSRVSYPKEMRERAQREGKGLCTISVQDEHGAREEYQGPVDEAALRFARWAFVLLATRHRIGEKLPDLRAAFMRRKKKAEARDAE